jgi:DHA1 family bicyclomycin/chloramphenicol resistance-like MFS transporter
MEKKPSPALFIILAMLIAGSLVSTEIYLPAIPAITLNLQSSPAKAQVTISSFLLGLTCTQLVYGPLSERIGRKLVLIIGLAIFFTSSLACVFTMSMNELIIIRFLQGIGACAGTVVGKAIVGDLFDQNTAAKIFASVFPLVGLSPAIAPLLGGYLTHYFGWRSTFFFMALYCLIALILVSIYFTESKKSTSNLKLLHTFKSSIQQYFLLIKNKQFLSYTFLASSAYLVYFIYIASSPFIFYQLGYSPKMIGYCLLNISIFYVIGNLISKRLLEIRENTDIFNKGVIIFASGGILMLILSYLMPSGLSLIIPMGIVVGGYGAWLPICTARIIKVSNNEPGYTSALSNFIQLGSAGFGTYLIAQVHCSDPVWLSAIILFIILIGLFFYKSAVKSYGLEQYI